MKGIKNIFLVLWFSANMSDKKNAKEASNIFHSIMKASVTPKKFDAEPCPKCGLLGDFIPPPQKDGKNLVVQYKCPNGHEYSKYVMLKYAKNEATRNISS